MSQISSSDELFKWLPRTTQLPWASAGQRPVFADREKTLRALAEPEFNPRTTVYLPLESSNALHQATGRAEIVSANYSAHRIELEVIASDPAMVILSQAYYPAWRATVGESPAMLWRANLGFQALQVPTGHHRIILRYSDTLFLIGGWTSALALLSCGLRLWFVRCGRSGAGALTSRSPPQV